MKIALLALALVTTVSFADVKVVSARYNYLNGTIVAQLQYGGCGTPAFKLQFDTGCFETIPLQSDAEVKQTAGDDGCERLNQSSYSFTLKGDPCGGSRHYVNLTGTNASNRVRVTVDPTLE